MHNLQHRALLAGLAALDHAAVDPVSLAPPGAAGAVQPGMNPQPEARKAGCNRPSADQTDFSADIVSDSAGEGKAEASMQARAALAGCGLFRLSEGEFLLTKWGMAKSCPDLRSVGALLNRLAGGAI